MEMNTRLQVEHPVTEFITGLDLVEWQLRVAAGERLPLTQEQISVCGHAIEVRLCAEDPERDFLPAGGTLRHLKFPVAGRDVRVDTGVRAGDTVTIHYDSLLAKLIVHGADREAAVRRLQAALRDTELVGVRTNRDFLAALASHPSFAAGEVDTGFIGRHQAELAAPAAPVDDAAEIVALFVVLQQRAAAARAAAASADPHSPWHDTGGWWLNAPPASPLPVSGVLEDGGEALVATVRGRQRRTTVIRDHDYLTLLESGHCSRLPHSDSARSGAGRAVVSGGFRAPMPGRVVAVHTKAGAAVKRGEVLLVLEAMKMEHAITAPADGVVSRVHFAAGDLVDEGVELLTLE
jgi:3-methylcrotonyl-CoA carboxylase alpha subunit